MGQLIFYVTGFPVSVCFNIVRGSVVLFCADDFRSPFDRRIIDLFIFALSFEMIARSRFITNVNYSQSIKGIKLLCDWSFTKRRFNWRQVSKTIFQQDFRSIASQLKLLVTQGSKTIVISKQFVWRYSWFLRAWIVTVLQRIRRYL